MFGKKNEPSVVNAAALERTIMRPVKDDKNRVRTGNIAGWGASMPYDEVSINALKLQLGSQQLDAIETTPTPFNRMELTRLAFKYILEMSEKYSPKEVLEGKSADHMLISECFDIGELFFYSDKYEEQISILQWQRDDLRALQQTPRQAYFGQALDRFVNDEKWKPLKHIYLLNCKDIAGASGMKILGGTSPYTLFFSADGDKSRANFIHGSYRTFGVEPVPLHHRNKDYIKFWFALKNYWQNPGVCAEADGSFASTFPELIAYLDLVYKVLDQEDHNLALELQVNRDEDKLLAYWTEMEPITVSRHREPEKVEPFNGFYLKKAPQLEVGVMSQFTIATSRALSVLPLVLPVDKKGEYEHLTYVQSKFNRNLPIPRFVKTPMEERRLPGESTKYPFLTESDFFYDTIILNDYAPDPNFFYGGANDAAYCILPPIKEKFFEYFTVKDLQRFLTISLVRDERAASRVEVSLRIPIQNGEEVRYKRIYEGAGTSEGFEGEFRGAVRVERFVLGVYPFVHLQHRVQKSQDEAEEMDRSYRVFLSRAFPSPEDLPLNASFYTDQAVARAGELRGMVPNRLVERNKRGGDATYDPIFPVAQTYVVEDTFEYICVSINNDIKGLLIPLWEDAIPQRTYTFAIDFGTSNTHVECFVKNEEASFLGTKLLENTAFQFANQIDFKAEDRLRQIMAYDAFPEGMGKKYVFPVRTVLSWGKSIHWSEPHIAPLAEANLPYVYGEYKLLEYDDSITNLKWNTEQESGAQMKAFLSSLLYQLRARVMRDAEIEKTNILYFFPKSMDGFHRSLMQRIWGELYRKYFGNNPNGGVLVNMLESLAPYYRYKNEYNGRTLCIDVGGETSDILYARDNNDDSELMVSSFRFASGALYGKDHREYRGFVKYFEKPIEDAINNIDYVRHPEISRDIHLAYKQIQLKRNTMDMINFFFSLKKRTSGVIDFVTLLREKPQFAAVYVVYLGAIIYHIAQMLKVRKGQDTKNYTPQYIAFSGNGAKSFDLLDDTREHRNLLAFIQSIFGYVLEENAPIDRVILRSNPKEELCAGGLEVMKHAKDSVEITRTVDKLVERSKAVILLGDRELTTITEDEDMLHYEKLTDQHYEAVIANVEDFYDMLISNMGGRFSFDRVFSKECRQALVEQLGKEKGSEFLMQDLVAIIKKRAGQNQEEEVSESLFFFPIVGSLSRIADRLADAAMSNNY